MDGLNFLYPSCAPFAYNGSFLPPCTYEARGAIISFAMGIGELVVWGIGGVRIGEEGWRLLGCSRMGWWSTTVRGGVMGGDMAVVVW